MAGLGRALRSLGDNNEAEDLFKRLSLRDGMKEGLKKRKKNENNEKRERERRGRGINGETLE